MDNFNCTYKMAPWAPPGIQYMPGLRWELAFLLYKIERCLSFRNRFDACPSWGFHSSRPAPVLGVLCTGLLVPSESQLRSVSMAPSQALGNVDKIVKYIPSVVRVLYVSGGNFCLCFFILCASASLLSSGMPWETAVTNIFSRKLDFILLQILYSFYSDIFF